MQSYGLADKLLSQGAIMVMAVSSSSSSDHQTTSLTKIFSQAFYNPGPNGIEV